MGSCTRLLLVALALALPACGGEAAQDAADVSAARAAFGRFQSALFAGDRDTVAELLTAESRPAVDGLPWADLRTKQPLLVNGAHVRPGAIDVVVTDPNERNRLATWVLVRERGHWCVDLLATAVADRKTQWSAEPWIAPGALDAAEIDEIAARPAAGIR